MTCRPAIALLAASLLLSVTGCVMEPQPYAYRTYPPQNPAPQPSPGMPPQPSQERPEVLSRGPVHEAFAQPVAAQDQPDMVVTAQPPPNIVETPPADRPEGGACFWAPGYWSWDAERITFIWVSGCWRMPPPRMTWVPGYWTRVPAGWQWVPGFWSPATAQEIAYLPAPPEVTDFQPPGPPPAADEFWVPGCWYWHQERYVFRAGYWLRQQPGWMWFPSHCAWTPRGYVFVEGHWDYALERRGVLFAPVCFPGRISAGIRFSFSPSITVDVGVLSASLFACPRYAHYYFGDYYDDAYARIGIYPWFDCVRIGTWYDPVFVYSRWDHCRTDPRWEERERHAFTLRHDHMDLRPPRTYREQEARVAHLPDPERREHQMTRPLSTVVATPTPFVTFEHMNADVRQKIAQQSQESHNFRDARSRWEATPAPAPPAAPIQPPVLNTRPASRTMSARPPRDAVPTLPQPDRVQLPSSYAGGQTATSRSGDRTTPDRSPNEYRHDRSRDDR